MAFLKEKEKLLLWFDSHNKKTDTGKPYWTIFASKGQSSDEKGRCFLKSSEEPNLSETKSRDDFSYALDNLMNHGTRYYIRLREKPEKSTMEAATEYTHVDENESNRNGIAGMAATDVESKIAQAIAKEREQWNKDLEHKTQLQKLQDKIDKMEADDGFNKISGWLDHPTVKALVPAIASRIITPHKPQTDVKLKLDGIPAHNEAITVEESDKISKTEQALEVLYEADPNSYEVIQKLAKIAKENPGQYNMYRPMLLNL